MSNIKVLDCTLRDGGYINNWDFKKEIIFEIINNIAMSRIDYIECGFLKSVKYDSDKTLFSSIEDLNKIIETFSFNSSFALMINFGEYNESLLPKCQNKNIALRVAFKKYQKNEALNYCFELKNKGYDVFINPMHTGDYSTYELLELIEQVNKLHPRVFTIVDTTGGMRENDVLSLYHLIDKNLSKDIALAFHLHNNLQLSFINAQCLLNVCKTRELIIDSTVFGMGRGAGNICTELLLQYINDNYSCKYDVLPILNIIDKYINPIYKHSPWGYSVPYYLTAINHCHPNYAKFLSENGNISAEKISNILNKIPADKKLNYNEEVIKKIFSEVS